MHVLVETLARPAADRATARLSVVGALRDGGPDGRRPGAGRILLRGPASRGSANSPRTSSRSMREALREDTGDDRPAAWDVRYYDAQAAPHGVRHRPDPGRRVLPARARLGRACSRSPARSSGSTTARSPTPPPGIPTSGCTRSATARSGELLALPTWTCSRARASSPTPRRSRWSSRTARRAGERTIPVSAIVANFTPPAAGRPALLRHEEVVTLFHEFGHILHMSLAQAEFVRFSGAETESDFVEAPSQIMEHWAWNADVLRRFARHYATGEPIPTELVDQLVAARNLNVGDQDPAPGLLRPAGPRVPRRGRADGRRGDQPRWRTR